ncbi:MAG: hypothetical protein MUE63_11095 [Xanthomonadales bacterium]|nr:hypothetical protein [Xanthomonadales bacterium]
MSKGSTLALAARGIAVAVLLLTAGLAAAARPAEPLHRYIVEFPDPPLALYDGRELAAASPAIPAWTAVQTPRSPTSNTSRLGTTSSASRPPERWGARSRRCTGTAWPPTAWPWT